MKLCKYSSRIPIRSLGFRIFPLFVDHADPVSQPWISKEEKKKELIGRCCSHLLSPDVYEHGGHGHWDGHGHGHGDGIEWWNRSVARKSSDLYIFKHFKYWRYLDIVKVHFAFRFLFHNTGDIWTWSKNIFFLILIRIAWVGYSSQLWTRSRDSWE